MEKRTGEKICTLTYSDEVLATIEPSDYVVRARRDVKRLNDFLYAEAMKHGWAYEIVEVASVNDHKTTGKRLHIHVYLKANPCQTAFNKIKNYWENSKGFGIVTIPKGEVYNSDYYVNDYMKGQAIKYKTGPRTEICMWGRKLNDELLKSNPVEETIETTVDEVGSELRSPLFITDNSMDTVDHTDNEADIDHEDDCTTLTGMEEFAWVNQLTGTSSTRLYLIGRNRLLPPLLGCRAALVDSC